MHAMLEIQVHLKTILIIKCCFLDSFAKRSKSKNCRISRDSSQWGSEVLYYYIQCINVLTYIFTYRIIHDCLEINILSCHWRVYEDITSESFLIDVKVRGWNLLFSSSRAFSTWMTSQIRYWLVCPNYLWIQHWAVM